VEDIYLAICLIIIIILVAWQRYKTKQRKIRPRKPQQRYDRRGFDHNHIHKNGTKYDDYGYDYFGYNADGYNIEGYNKLGKNHKGQYNRLHDTKSCDDGFCSPKLCPIALTTHARHRMQERLGINDFHQMDVQAFDAYRYGRSKRQIKKTSAYLVEEIEQRYENSVVLIYRNVIYIFSCDNVLKTVYKNDRIPL